MTFIQFKLSDVGEGLTEATIIQWLVEVGQHVDVDTPLVEIETEKANVVLPSPFSGIIRELHCSLDTTLSVGSPLISIDTDEYVEPQQVTAEVTSQSNSDTPNLLVGYGALNGSEHDLRSTVRATPLVRKMARELNIDLTKVSPSGKHGEVTRNDILRSESIDENDSHSLKLTGIRKHMARAMVRSAAEAPQATLCATVDMSDLIALNHRLNSHPEFRELKITPFTVIAHCFVRALKTVPLANSSIDSGKEQLTVHDFVNLGVAIATKQGLVVPNLKSAESLNLVQFARGLSDIISDARNGDLRPEQFAGGTVSITNIGALGIETGVPLLNPGQAVILAVGSIERRPWVVSTPEERLEIRPIVQLALTIDHRILDGSEAANLLNAIAELVGDPSLMSIYS